MSRTVSHPRRDRYRFFGRVLLSLTSGSEVKPKRLSSVPYSNSGVLTREGIPDRSSGTMTSFLLLSHATSLSTSKCGHFSVDPVVVPGTVSCRGTPTMTLPRSVSFSECQVFGKTQGLGKHSRDQSSLPKGTFRKGHLLQSWGIVPSVPRVTIQY